MVVESSSRDVLRSGDQPPFLTEPSRPTVPPPPVHANARLIDFLDRFRPGLIALALPVLAVGAAVIYFANDSGSSAADEKIDVAPASSDAAVSALEPLANSIEGEEQIKPTARPAAAVDPGFSEPIPADGFVDEPPPPPPTSRATTPSTAAPTTAPATTVAPTTAPPPTDPPDLCKARVGGPTALMSEPKRRSDQIGEVLKGSYPVTAAKRSWIQLNVGGTQGWIRSRAVTELTGNC